MTTLRTTTSLIYGREVQDVLDDGLCHGIVTRDGIEDACCKDATTIIYDPESVTLWPACTWHANRYGGALSLATIRTALAEGIGRHEWED